MDGQNLYPAKFTKSDILTKNNKTEKGKKLNKGKKKHYKHGNINRRQVAKSDDRMTRLNQGPDLSFQEIQVRNTTPTGR